jgi:hypothetical protein
LPGYASSSKVRSGCPARPEARWVDIGKTGVVAPRRREHRSARSDPDPASELVNLLASVAFEDIPEPESPEPEEVEALLAALLLGVLDDHLERIAAVVKMRIEVINGMRNLIAHGRFCVGDRVRFSEDMRPRYLVGCLGTVIDKDVERLVVKIDEPTGRYESGEVKTRAIYLESVAE